MARALYSHELSDPDFSWLISNFVESHTEYVMCESAQLPIVFIAGSPIAGALPPKPETDPTDLIGEDI